MQFRKDTEILLAAASHWSAMSDFRNERERCKRYCYGRQWDDIIEVDGRRMREEDYIRSQGNIPLKNNLIRRMVRSVVGVYRNQYSYPDPSRLRIDTSGENGRRRYERLRLNADYNRLDELHARTMEEFLISGLAVHRKTLARGSGPYMPELGGVRTDYVAPDTFFIDAATRDFRGWDARMVGQTHDLDFPALCAALAHSAEDCRRLRETYPPEGGNVISEANDVFGSPTVARDFYTPSAPGMCRVIEIWTREIRPRYRVHDPEQGRIYRIDEGDLDLLPEGASVRWMADECWSYRFLSPSGDVLAEGDSPLPGGGHPYVWRAYPYIDGEIHSFVADVIDQQRHTNRLITLYDWVLRSTAKGVLLFPESALPEGVDIDDISDEWSRFNGVILFRPKAGMPLPQQVCGNASQVGITDLLDIQLKMLEDVSGVSSALEGKISNGNISGTLYDQQTRQAMTALLDILESYNSFARDGALLDSRLLTTYKLNLSNDSSDLQ